MGAFTAVLLSSWRFEKVKEKPDEDTSGAGHTCSPQPLPHKSHVHVYQDVYMLMPSVDISDGPH